MSLDSVVAVRLVDLRDNFKSDKYTDQEKNGMLNEVIERTKLFPTHLSNGRYVKGITFKFPIFTDGKYSKQWWYKQGTDESICLLVKK